KLGLEFIDHQFIPNTPAVRSAGVDMDYGSPNIYSAGELAFYLGDEFKFNSRLTLYGGLRFTRYKPKKQLAGTQDENVQVNHAEEAVIYQYAEPRLTLHYQLSEDEVFKASLSRNIQPVHMISVTAVNFPSDFWMPSVKGLPPARGMQFSAGYYRNFSSRKYESYIDFYYKKMDKLVEFSGGLMNLIDNLEIEDYLFSGGGNAYGSEISVKKNAGRLTGWMGYTLSWSNRSFPEINDGKRFP